MPRSEYPLHGDSSVHRVFPSEFSLYWLDKYKLMIYSSKNYAHGLVYEPHKYMACKFNTLHTKGINDGDRMYTGVGRNAPEGGQAEKRKCHTQNQFFFLLASCARRLCPCLWPRHPFYPSFISATLAGSAPGRGTVGHTVRLTRDSLSYMGTICHGVDSGDECSALLIYNVYWESIVGFAGKIALVGERVARVYPIPLST